jgi:hypothetical protein
VCVVCVVCVCACVVCGRVLCECGVCVRVYVCVRVCVWCMCAWVLLCVTIRIKTQRTDNNMQRNTTQTQQTVTPLPEAPRWSRLWLRCSNTGGLERRQKRQKKKSKNYGDKPMRHPLVQNGANDQINWIYDYVCIEIISRMVQKKQQKTAQYIYIYLSLFSLFLSSLFSLLSLSLSLNKSHPRSH